MKLYVIESTEWEPQHTIRCSFCGKSRDEVRKMHAGPTVYICDECVNFCDDIIVEDWDTVEIIRPATPPPTFVTTPAGIAAGSEH